MGSWGVWGDGDGQGAAIAGLGEGGSKCPVLSIVDAIVLSGWRHVSCIEKDEWIE